MHRKGSVPQLRKPRRTPVAPGPARHGKLKFSRHCPGLRVLRRPLGSSATPVCRVLAPAIPLAGLVAAERPAGRHQATIMMAKHAPSVDGAPLYVSWPDGDSGTIAGRLFRLYGVDAPEGSRSCAQCAAQRLRAVEARSSVRTLTDGGAVEIRKSRGTDKYNRDLLSFSADWRDIASSLVASGHAKRWNSEAGEIKPRWCAT